MVYFFEDDDVDDGGDDDGGDSDDDDSYRYFTIYDVSELQNDSSDIFLLFFYSEIFSNLAHMTMLYTKLMLLILPS